MMGPLLDRYVSDTWVFAYEWSVPAATILAASCCAAIFVNLSQFACLGRFSAVSFQVCQLVRMGLFVDSGCGLVASWCQLPDTASCAAVFEHSWGCSMPW